MNKCWNNNNNNKPAWVKVQYPSELLSSSETLTMLGIYRWFCINCMRFLSTTGSSWGIIYFLKGSWLRRVWRYQRGNQNPMMEVGTLECQKKKEDISNSIGKCCLATGDQRPRDLIIYIWMTYYMAYIISFYLWPLAWSINL
jgi:hypothetical protein